MRKFIDKIKRLFGRRNDRIIVMHRVKVVGPNGEVLKDTGWTKRTVMLPGAGVGYRIDFGEPLSVSVNNELSVEWEMIERTAGDDS